MRDIGTSNDVSHWLGANLESTLYAHSSHLLDFYPGLEKNPDMYWGKNWYTNS